jgi:hypothetical protein
MYNNSYNKNLNHKNANHQNSNNLNYNNNKFNNNQNSNNLNYNNNKFNNQNSNNKFNNNKFNNDINKESDTIYSEDNDELNQIKIHLLDFLYNKIEVNEHKYTIIKNIGDVYDLKSKKYYVSGNSCGINSFIIFMKKDNNYYSYLIDRRSISYNRQSLKKSSVRISEIKLAVDLKMYDGTIMDGIIIDNDNNIVSSKNTVNSNKLTFMISDVFMINGKSIINMDYKQKMFFVSTILNKTIETTNKTNNIDIICSRPYELNQMKSMFLELSNNIKNHNIKGITYYPQYSGTKLIYIFDKQDEKYKNSLLNGEHINNEISILCDENENNIDDNLDKKIIYKFELTDLECIDDINLNLEMIKTTISDVYKIYAIFNINNKFIKKKIGVAYIPTYILSLKCKILFCNKDSIIMNCKFNSYKNKWIPVDEASVQKIDIITNEKRIKVIEQEIISDNDILDD